MPVKWKWFERHVLQSKWGSDPVLVLLVLWGLFIVYATLLPFNFSASAELIRSDDQAAVGATAEGGLVARRARERALVSSLGILARHGDGTAGRRLHRQRGVAMCTGAFLSGSVELPPVVCPESQHSFIDLVTNSFGATVGALVGWPWARLVWPVVSIRLRQLIGARPLAACALVTGVVLLFAGSFAVWFQARSARREGGAWRCTVRSVRTAGGARLRSAKPLNWAAELLTWTLAGGLFRAGCAGIAPESGAAASAGRWRLRFGLEPGDRDLQLAIPDRDVDLTSVVLALLGSAAGAVIVQRAGDRDPRRLIKPAIAIWAWR